MKDIEKARLGTQRKKNKREFMERRRKRNGVRGSFIIQIVLRIILILWDENAEPRGSSCFQ